MGKVVKVYLEKLHPTTGEESLEFLREFPTMKHFNKWSSMKGLEGYDITQLIVKTEEK